MIWKEYAIFVIGVNVAFVALGSAITFAYWVFLK